MTTPNENTFAPAAPRQERAGAFDKSRAMQAPNQDSAPPQGWSAQDPELRDRWLRGEVPQEIADALGRSIAAIMTRAARLGLPRRFAPGRKPGQRGAAPKAAPQEARRHGDAAAAKSSAAEPETVVDPGEAVRLCLMCTSSFQSSGRHNRICPKCKDSPDYAAGCRVTDVNFEV